jgi:hypothetical protein
VPASDPAYALRPLDGPVRLIRSLAAALVCVAAAAIGHHTAGGPLPATAVLAVLAGATAIAWLLAARRVTPGQLVGLLVLCQVGVHLGTSTGEMAMGLGMLAGHLLATVASAVVLARGEAFVWHLAERLGLRLAPLRPAATVLPSTRGPVMSHAPRSLRNVRLAHSRVLRGPPAGA